MIDNETFSSTDQLAKLSSNVLLEKTGKGWDTWIKWLDKAAAENLTHKALVSMLESHVESMWYRQKIALGYREAKGKRELGEIASGYEVGIRHTFPLTAKQAWQFITSREALDIWLGPLKTGKFREGSSFETTDGLTGTITVLGVLIYGCRGSLHSGATAQSCRCVSWQTRRRMSLNPQSFFTTKNSPHHPTV